MIRGGPLSERDPAQAELFRHGASEPVEPVRQHQFVEAHPAHFDVPKAHMHRELNLRDGFRFRESSGAFLRHENI